MLETGIALQHLHLEHRALHVYHRRIAAFSGLAVIAEDSDSVALGGQSEQDFVPDMVYGATDGISPWGSGSTSAVHP